MRSNHPKMWIRSETIAEPLTIDDLQQRLGEAPRDTLLYFWTPTEIELLRHYAPTTYVKIREEGDHQAPNAVKLARLIFQAQSELVNKQSVLDAGILAGKRNANSVRQHVYNYNTLCSLFSFLGAEAPSQITREDFSDEELDHILIEAKWGYASLLANMPAWLTPVDTVTKTAEDLGTARGEQYGYIDEVLELIGRNVKAIVLYGSASREADPAQFKDRDNYLVVENGSLPRVYGGLRGRRFKPSRDGKPVSFNVLEESSFTQFLRMNHDPQESLEYCKVLYGEAKFPVVPEVEIQQRGLSYAVLRAKSLKSAAAWQMKTPGFLQSVPDLFDYFQKTQLFMIQAGLNWTEGVRGRSKEEFRAILSELGGEAVPYRGDSTYIARAICQAAVTTPRIAERFFKGAEFKGVQMDLKATSVDLDKISRFDSMAIQFLGYH